MLTIGDIALLRDAFTWARANGWRPVETDRKSREWSQVDILDGPTVNLVKRDMGPDYDLRVYEDDPGRRTFVESTSVRRAIDVLVAVGVLPLEFCSARVVGKKQFGVRRVGYRSVRVTSERHGRSLLRNWVVPGELVKRHISEWEVA